MESKNAQENLVFEHFSVIEDKRQAIKVKHKLIDIIGITIFAAIAGIVEWEEIEEWAKERINWLKKYLELPNGIPSHDTISRTFSWIKPEIFYQCFMKWINEIAHITEGEIIAIDGKTLKGSIDKANGRTAIHMVHAWACSNELLIGELKTESKSNEITAIPKLLEMLDIKGCIVTIDAMGTQKDIAEKIRGKKADYVLALKGNHPLLCEEVTKYFEFEISENFEGVKYDYFETVEKGHGRIEKRKYWITENIEWLEVRGDWKDLKSIGMVESTREINGEKSIETRYYISSIEANAEKFAVAVRSHWGVENKLHWVLDVVFKEDSNKIRKDHAPENMALIRRIALNLIKLETSAKKSGRKKMFKALISTTYMEKVLLNIGKLNAQSN